MPPDQLSYLTENYERLSLVMLRHCILILATRYGLNAHTILPRAKDAQEVVLDVIEKYLSGERKFVEGHSIESQLKQGITSWLSSLFRSADNRTEALNENHEHAIAISHEANPSESVANRQDYAVLFSLLRASPEVAKNEDLKKLVTAIEDGADDVPSQVVTSGLTTKRVYELRNMLKTIVPRILKKFNGTITHAYAL